MRMNNRKENIVLSKVVTRSAEIYLTLTEKISVSPYYRQFKKISSSRLVKNIK